MTKQDYTKLTNCIIVLKGLLDQPAKNQRADMDAVIAALTTIQVNNTK